MGQIGYHRGAGQLWPILGEGRWFRASNVEEQAFLAEVRPTITDYWRSPVPLASVVRPSKGFITTNEERVSPNDDFIPTGRTTAERRVINTDQTIVSALGTTHRCSVRASWIGEGPTDAAPPSSSTPPATLAEIPPPVPAEPPASVRPRRQSKPCRHYVPETGKGQERWRSRCINTRLYTIYHVVWL